MYISVDIYIYIRVLVHVHTIECILILICTSIYIYAHLYYNINMYWHMIVAQLGFEEQGLVARVAVPSVLRIKHGFGHVFGAWKILLGNICLHRDLSVYILC